MVNPVLRRFSVLISFFDLSCRQTLNDQITPKNNYMVYLQFAEVFIISTKHKSFKPNCNIVTIVNKQSLSQCN